MKKILIYLLYPFASFLLFLRYKIVVKGLKELDLSRLNPNQGTLLLATHTAEVDPPLLLKVLWKKFKPHPVALESLFHDPFVRNFLELVDGISVPNFEDSSNSYKRKQMEKSYEKIFDLLKKKEALLIYPSGGLKRGSEEVVGGSSGVRQILQEMPDLNIVLVRVTGLWGSIFSKALTGKSTPIGKAFGQIFFVLLKNLIFFTPRRKVLVEIEQAGEDFPRRESRLVLNKYLENWFNKNGPEPINLVSYSFWKDKLPTIEAKKQEEVSTVEMVPLQVKERVSQEIASIAECDVDVVQPEKDLAKDLGLDSLDIAQLVVFLKEQYGVLALHNSELTTVGSVMLFASHLKTSRNGDDEDARATPWHQMEKRPFPTQAQGSNILEAFFLQCDRMDGHAACIDAVSGQLSYSKLKQAVIALSYLIKKMPADRIGIMLPASSAFNIVALATLLAKKTPVMLNWTLGSRNLSSVVSQAKIEQTISSWSFLDKLDNVELNCLDDRIVLLENMKREVGLKNKVRAFFLSRKKAKTLLRKFGVDQIKEEDTAVILFTSGTENFPKGVPLTHGNILSNQRGAFETARMQSNEIMIGILPPFHSFGFSVTGLLPILAGIPVAYSPNPTDGRRVAQAIEKWDATLLCIAPTFLRTLLRVATKEQFKSLRLVVTGAEKTPKEVYDKIRELNPKTIVAEGYGITECSPILTLNPPYKPPKKIGEGVVGMPLPDVDLLIIHPETHAKLEANQMGLVLTKGPNVFNGYLDRNISSPFIELEGAKWYNTGDLGSLDEEGYLTLSGRLKRFVKIGGEMISLAAVEEVLSLMAKEPNGPSIAVLATEEAGKKGEMVVFSTFPLTLEDANKKLRLSGMSNLVRISKIEVVPALPLLGSGKINYRALQA